MSTAKTKSVLRPVGTATIDASTTPFDAAAAVVTRQSLYIWEGFIERLRNHAHPVESMEAFALPYSDLVEDADDFKIVSSLGASPEFSATEVCYVIDCLTKRQPKGEDGVLLANRYANLFYVKGGPVIRVHWGAGYGKWLVSDWPRGGYRWGRGRRAFGRN